MKLFLDSSVLVATFLVDCPHHIPSLRLYKKCTRESAFCASHSLAEVYSTSTRLPLPHRATPDQALEFLESIDSGFGQVSLEDGEYLATIRQAVANRVSGGAIYDALIAGCAVKAGADRIFTWNIRHYRLLGADVSTRIGVPDAD